MKVQEEFLFLLRFNLLAYFKIHNEYHPNKHRLNLEHYDDLDSIRAKVREVIHFDKPARANANMFPISITVPETHLSTIAELEEHIKMLNNKKAGFVISSMAKKTPVSMTRNDLNAKLFSVMQQNRAERLQAEAEAAIEYIIDLCQLSEVDEANFYSDLDNNPHAWNGFSTILEQSIREFNSQVFNPSKADEIIHVQCGCMTGDLEKYKDNYLRKSFALKIAYEAGKNDNQPLWAYKCPKVTDSIIWHLTKRDQTSY